MPHIPNLELLIEGNAARSEEIESLQTERVGLHRQLGEKQSQIHELELARDQAMKDFSHELADAPQLYQATLEITLGNKGVTFLSPWDERLEEQVTTAHQETLTMVDLDERLRELPEDSIVLALRTRPVTLDEKIGRTALGIEAALLKLPAATGLSVEYDETYHPINGRKVVAKQVLLIAPGIEVESRSIGATDEADSARPYAISAFETPTVQAYDNCRLHVLDRHNVTATPKVVAGREYAIPQETLVLCLGDEAVIRQIAMLPDNAKQVEMDTAAIRELEMAYSQLSDI